MTTILLKPVNVSAIERNINLVFKYGDIGKLSTPTYKLIIGHMGFIAHYSLQGFQNLYSDLRQFARTLQTSEYSNDFNYNLKWAKRLETDPDYTKSYGRDYVLSVSSAIRSIVDTAKKYYPMLPGFYNPKAKRGGNKMTKRVSANPKRCPICRTLSEWRFQAGGWYCPKCKSWFFPSELSGTQFRSYMRGHTNPRKTRKPRQMKILGIPVMTVVIIGGLVWLVTRS